MASNILELHDVHAGYGKKTVLNGVYLSVAAGSVVALIGPNGAGKTTTIKSIVGAVKCRGGSITLDGADVTNLAPASRIKRGIGVVPSDARSFGDLSVRQNLELGGYTLKQGAAVKKQLDWIYSIFPVLATRARQPARSLSGGERQLLAIGRALMPSPRVLLLDEPSLGLSPQALASVFAHLSNLASSGVGLLLVEQNVRAAFTIADTAEVMVSGSVRERVTDPQPDRVPELVSRALLGGTG